MKYNLKVSPILFLLIFFTELNGAIFSEIDTTRSLRCEFSSTHHNRIMIDESRVKKIVYPEDKLAISMEEHSGQAFVYATYPLKNLITLAVITESGLVQDLEIDFQDRPAEVIILKEPKLEETSKEETLSVLKDQRSVMEITIEEVLTGCIPAGYVPSPIPCKKWQLKTGIQAESIVRLDGAENVLYIYKLTNISRRKRQLIEGELECEGSQWVYLEKQILEPNEKSLGIVSVGNKL